MKEEFLHYVWKCQLFKNSDITLINGEKFFVQDVGQHNFDAGPDFFNSKVKINRTLWGGNVEVHIKSSDWLKHKHQNDKSYDNVILHVVYEHDKDIIDKYGNKIPTLELKNIIDISIYSKYAELMKAKNWISCASQIKEVDEFTIYRWLDRLVVERLERKASEIQNTLNHNNNSWEDTFYQYLFKYFGLKVNAQPFFQLATNTPLKIVEKHNSILSIEALFYGQAGFLSQDIDDDYFQSLKKEYTFLKAKFSLKEMDVSLWKFLRLRPNNFSTIRISQLSNLLMGNPRLFMKILNAKSIQEIQNCFKIKASDYWSSHYSFGKEVTKKEKAIGLLTINNLIINVVVPFIFVYGQSKSKQDLIDKALNYLELIKAENNSIIKKWDEIGVKASNSLQSQALIELKNNYCSEKKCLNCSIGSKILK